LDKQAIFVQPENIRNESMMDYLSPLDQSPPPGAEGVDEGNGKADEYLSRPDTGNVPVESQQTLEEQKVLKDANKDKQSDKKDDKSKDATDPNNDSKKKKDGFFKRLFGKKKDDQ
jgi:penicillin-binding protein 1A